MPLYDFRCSTCQSVHERLIAAGSKLGIHCPSCNGLCERVKVSTFSIAGAKPRTNESSLLSSAADFMKNPDKFVTSMDTFGEKVGASLTSTEKERAVERLKDAKP